MASKLPPGPEFFPGFRETLEFPEVAELALRPENEDDTMTKVEEEHDDSISEVVEAGHKELCLILSHHLCISSSVCKISSRVPEMQKIKKTS
jgi:hypothetical protein